MEITKMKTVPVKLPLEKSISAAIHSMRSLGCVLVYHRKLKRNWFYIRFWFN